VSIFVRSQLWRFCTKNKNPFDGFYFFLPKLNGNNCSKPSAVGNWVVKARVEKRALQAIWVVFHSFLTVAKKIKSGFTSAQVDKGINREL
jgi:hypothetical protein